MIPALGRLLAAPRALADLLLPRQCPVCRALLEPDERVLCADCRSELEPVSTPLCDRCGLPGPDPCPACRARAPGAVTRLRSAYAYAGPLRDAVLALKLGGRRELGDELGRLLARAPLPGWDWTEIELLVPVPLHGARLRERGFDQAAVIARALGEARALPVSLGRLERARPTERQARAVDRAARLAGVRGAFRVRAGHPFRGKRLGLVDDVATTGATLEACAEALLLAGAREVRAATVARTLPEP
jgi:ComF family protein